MDEKTGRQVMEDLLSLSPDHAYARAVGAVLADEIGQATDAVGLPDLTDGARHFNAGRLQGLRDLASVLEGLRARAAQERERKP